MLTQQRPADSPGLHWLGALIAAAKPASTTAVTEAFARELVEDLVSRFATAMTSRYGPGWATGVDLPDEAYLAEHRFAEQLSDLRDHLDAQLQAPPQ